MEESIGQVGGEDVCRPRQSTGLRSGALDEIKIMATGSLEDDVHDRDLVISLSR